MTTIRDAYGEALAAYGKADPRVVVLDADVSGSTKSVAFQKACPERFFNVGIAEANMTAMAAGFAASGKIPFVNTSVSYTHLDVYKRQRLVLASTISSSSPGRRVTSMDNT